MKLPGVIGARVALSNCDRSGSVLHGLLSANSVSRSMKYGPALVFHNHLCAMLTAAWHLGADDDALRDIASGVDVPGTAKVGEFQGGLRQLRADEEVAKALTINVENWREHLGGCGLYGYGSHLTYPAYRRFFEAERGRLGAEGALRAYFPTLASGVGGDFFHAIIELGYYFEGGCETPETLDSGLAWLASAYVQWPPNEGAGRVESPIAVMRTLITSDDGLPRFDLDDGSSGYISAMETLRDEHLETVYSYDLAITGKSELLKEICLASADSFASGGAKDFYTLHSLTGSRAVWAVLSSVDDWPDEVWRDCLSALWRTMIFTHIARRGPPGSTIAPPADTASTWPSGEMAQAALQKANSHVIKAVFTCADFYDRWHDPRHLATATAIIKHIIQDGGKLQGTGAGSKIENYTGKK